MNVGVLDHSAMLNLLGRLQGRRLLGVVDCNDCLELVFEESDASGNLVTLYTNGRHAGIVAFGFVCDPASYVDEWREWEAA
jgi:hypothetical protein